MKTYKQNGKSGIGYIIGDIIAVVIVFAVCVIPVIPYARHIKHKDKLVDISAVVSQVREGKDSDDDMYYDIYLSYEYENEKYNNIFWEREYNNELSSGDEVNVKISSEKPEYIGKRDIGANFLYFALFVVSVAVVCGVYDLGFYRKKTDAGNLDEKMVLWDLSPKAVFAVIYGILGMGAGMLGGSIFMPDMMINRLPAILCLAVGGAALIVASLLILMNNKNEYSISIHRCQKKWRESSTDMYYSYVQFENIPGNEHGRNVFKHAEEGEYYYVLTGSKGKIREIYNTRKWGQNIDLGNFKAAKVKVVVKKIINAVLAAVIMFSLPALLEGIARIIAGFSFI